MMIVATSTMNNVIRPDLTFLIFHVAETNKEAQSYQRPDSRDHFRLNQKDVLCPANRVAQQTSFRSCYRVRG